MNLLELLLSDENKSAIDQLAKQFNLNPEQTRGAVEGLVPALSRGLENNTSSTKGLDELLDALETGNHGNYINEPDILGKPETTKDGNDILGHIFGNKEVSREVAKSASQASGLTSTLLKKMLPVVASLAMGALSKRLLGGSNSRVTNRSTGGGLIGALLDSDGDGSIWDDILSMGAKAMLR